MGASVMCRISYGSGHCKTFWTEISNNTTYSSFLEELEDKCLIKNYFQVRVLRDYELIEPISSDLVCDDLIELSCGKYRLELYVWCNDLTLVDSISAFTQKF